MGFGVLQLVRGRPLGEDRASGPEGADTTWLPAGAPARASCATEVVSFPLHAGNAEPRLVVSRRGDVLGGVWYRLKLGGSRPVPDVAYDLIREVRLSIGGQVVERFSGSALGLLARHDPKAACSRLGRELAFPLRLCASRLPLVALAYHEVVVDLALVAGIEVASHSYEVAYVSLDDAERCALTRLTPHRLAVTQKLSLRRRFVVHSPRPVRLALDLPELRNRVRDVAFRVDDEDDDGGDPLLSCALVCRYPGLREEVRYGMDAIMLGGAIPREYYGCAGSASTYFMTFDHCPTREHSGSALSVPSGAFELELSLRPGAYEVDVLVRHENELIIASGMAGLRWPPAEASASASAETAETAETAKSETASRGPRS